MSPSLRTGTIRVDGAADPIAGPLPILRGGRPETQDGAGFDAEMRRNLSYGRPASYLPYTRQDGYNRVRAPRELPTVVLDNGILTATFLPGYGGRLWSLVHRPTGRELLHRNPILQPANLAIRDAWLAGGVEWNLGATGHWPLTCEPLHAARVTAPDGTPVLRMFEFERLRRLVLRIDAWLPEGSPVLFVHVRVHNPAEHETPVYWWSNIAVPQTPTVRVLGPADQAFHFDYARDLRLVPFPQHAGLDQSYPGRVGRAGDCFLDIPDGERHWIAALDETGTGLVQASTETLRGRKVFCWGTAAGGRHWQEWLSGPDAAYLEIQAGLARTQLEHVPMPAGQTWSWTEAYGMLSADPEAVHGPWEHARRAAGAALDALIAPEALRAAGAAAEGFGTPDEVLFRGSGWGALEIEAGSLTATPQLPFGSTGPVQAPWSRLLSEGRLAICDPPAAPIVGPRWRDLVAASAGDWHSLYQLGLMCLADGDTQAARDAFTRSTGEQPTPWALRALAFLATDPADAAQLMTRAHQLRPDLRALAAEALDALLDAGQGAQALDLIRALNTADRAHGRIRLAEAWASHACGDDDRARQLLSEGIQVDNMREGELSLGDLWRAVYPGRPVPPAYDFSMAES
jgi:Domain of unknown function (DUF5107)